MSNWWSRFGKSWANLGLTDDPTFAQADAGWAYIGQAPPTVEQFNSTLQWGDQKDNWLYGQIANVISSAGMSPNEHDLTQLLAAITGKLKIMLTGPTTFYFDSRNGNDSTGTGEQGNPWRTVQHGIVWIAQHIEQAYQTITLQLAYGDYDWCMFTLPASGGIVISGDRSNPRTVVFKNPNGACIVAIFGANIIVQGVSFEGIGTDTIDYQTWGCGLQAQQAAQIAFRDVAFGPCSHSGMVTQIGGSLWPFDGDQTHYQIYGGGRQHILSSTSGVTTIVRNIIQIVNNPNFSNAFLACAEAGVIQAWYATYNGPATGARASAWVNGIIALNGADPNTTLPGSLPATTGAGGQII